MSGILSVMFFPHFICHFVFNNNNSLVIPSNDHSNSSNNHNNRNSGSIIIMQYVLFETIYTVSCLLPPIC